MKYSITFIIFCAFILSACNFDRKISIPSIHKIDKAFNGIIYDSVFAYEFKGSTDSPFVNSRGELSKNILRKVLLRKDQIDTLENILSDSSSYGGDVATCWSPHFGVEFYSKTERQAYLSICLLCNGMDISFQIQIRERMGEKGLGFSKNGIQKILSFCKSLHFTIYLEEAAKIHNVNL